MTHTVPALSLSVNNIARFEVIYTPTPESPGSALAGSINMVPRSAFERSRPQFNGTVFLMMKDNYKDWHKTTKAKQSIAQKKQKSKQYQQTHKQQLKAKAQHGAKVRILLGDPDSEVVAQRGQEEGIGPAMAGKVPPQDMQRWSASPKFQNPANRQRPCDLDRRAEFRNRECPRPGHQIWTGRLV